SNASGVALGFQTTAVVTVVDSERNENWDFLGGLYRGLLGRDIRLDETSLLTPLDAARNANLPAIIKQFVTSKEYLANLLNNPTTGFYPKFLGRGPSQAEVDSWYAQFQGGATIEGIAAALVGSAEYFQSPAKGNNNIASWTQSVYKDLLGRGASAA